MYHFLIKILIISLSTILISCTTISKRKSERNQYLQSFIGQSSDLIQQNFDLSKIGIHAKTISAINKNQLIFKFERILTTPVPVPMVTDGRQRLAATQIGSLANSERTFMPCYIICDLDNNIAQSFKTVGKAC